MRARLIAATLLLAVSLQAQTQVSFDKGEIIN